MGIDFPIFWFCARNSVFYRWYNIFKETELIAIVNATCVCFYPESFVVMLVDFNEKTITGINENSFVINKYSYFSRKASVKTLLA